MTKRTCDIRVRNAVARSGDPDLFLDLDIPRSTALQVNSKQNCWAPSIPQKRTSRSKTALRALDSPQRDSTLG
jgi:hypothetical protein